MHGAPAGRPEKRVYRSAAARSITRSNVLASSPMEKVGEPVYVRYLAPNWAMGVLSIPGPPKRARTCWRSDHAIHLGS
jgi:hypothetical protein